MQLCRCVFASIKKFIERSRRFLSTHQLGILGIVSLTPLAAYYYQFGKADISDDPEDWANFGDYIGGVYSVLMTIVAVYLTRKLERKDAMSYRRKQALGDIYQQFVRMQDSTSHQLAKNATRFLAMVEMQRLNLTESQIQRCQMLGDYFICVASNSRDRDINYEDEMKEALFNAYNIE